jgi:uncharacterized membrane protein
VVRVLGGSQPVPSASAPVVQQAAPTWAERTWWTIAGCMLLNWSVQLLTASTTFRWAAVLLVACGAWGLATAVASWLPLASSERFGRRRNLAAWMTAVMLVGTFAAWALVEVRISPGYGTDELAFDQYAAQLVQHGLNPYLHSMAPALTRFQVSPDGYTYTLTGAPVTAFSYPALGFLVYVPFLAIGWSTQLAVALDVIAWGAAVLLVFKCLPRPMRGAGLVLGSISVYAAYAIGGVTDVLYVPLLVGVAYRWDQFGLSRRSYLGPVLLGLAMSIKQTPWLLLPFIVLGLAVDEYGRAGLAAAIRRGSKYVLVALVAFLIPNLPYAIASPSAWWNGMLTPLTGDLVPAGQGTVALSLFVRLGGGSLLAFTAATALFGLLLLLVYLGTYPLLRSATFALPALVFFFASRSYGNYLVSLLPAALVAAVTCGEGLRDRKASSIGERVRRLGHSRVWRIATALVAAGFLGALAHALSARPPLALRVTAVRTSGQLATIEQLSLRVTNRTDSSVHPAFTLDESGALTTFWLRSRGPAVLAPRTSATYTLRAPNFPAQPPIAGGFTVVAFIRDPPSVSASAPYAPSSMHVALVPDAVNQPVRVGRQLVIDAELLDPFDRRVRRPNVPVYLGQTIYSQSGVQFSEAVINSSEPGATPVRAWTNSQGVATFVIVGTQATADPVYFEANLVNANEGYPYGYSPILPIRFANP